MRNWLPSSLLYSLLGSFIIGWWWLAFTHYPFHLSSPALNVSTSPLDIQLSTLFPYLSPVTRESIYSVLSGQLDKASVLMTQWDIDAQILQSKGVAGIERLSSEDYLKAHVLTRLIQEYPKSDLAHLNRQVQLPVIQDDMGYHLNLQLPRSRWLPQTYVTASFLLAIASPEEILAIPKGLRHLPQLYSPSLLNQIPANIEDYHSESLYLARPDLAFVAPYSHPSRLDMLRNQGIDLCTIQHIDNLDEIQNSLLKVGQITHHPLEATLLYLFMKACFLMVDNRLRALDQLQPQDHPTQVLFLCCRRHLMMPTSRCLTGHLLQRMMACHSHLSCPVSSNTQEWQTLCSQETIKQLRPEILILSLPYTTQREEHLDLSHLLNVLTHHSSPCSLLYVDDTVQESPNQYLALAYFDLFQALAAFYLPSHV